MATELLRSSHAEKFQKPPLKVTESGSISLSTVFSQAIRKHYNKCIARPSIFQTHSSPKKGEKIYVRIHILPLYYRGPPNLALSSSSSSVACSAPI